MKLTPMRAIRLKCLDCVAQQPQEVRLCIDEKCPLWRYRMGHRPKDDQIPTEKGEGEKSQDTPQIFGKDEG